MKRVLAGILMICTLFSVLSGCAASPGETTAPTETKHMLDGKKVIIIGNSHTYAGKTVVDVAKTVRDQKSRENNRGMFYYLCQQKGAEVAVTNWCFSGHGLGAMFGGPCDKSYCDGEWHENYLVDRYFDYVVVTPGVGNYAPETMTRDFDYITKFFRDANPNVKFVLLGNASSYGNNKDSTPYPTITDHYQVLKQQGWAIADWGKIVNDIIKGIVTVPDSAMEYNKNSFINKDGYHPNLLSGYVTTMMLYCAMTGEDATTLPRDFFAEGSLWGTLMPQILEAQSDGGLSGTNAHLILTSDNELLGIQQLIDQYLERDRG